MLSEFNDDKLLFGPLLLKLLCENKVIYFFETACSSSSGGGRISPVVWYYSAPTPNRRSIKR